MKNKPQPQPRHRQTIDFGSQSLIDRINNHRSTPEWGALSFSKRCLILLEEILNQREVNDRAIEFVKNLALGRKQNILDVQKLADDLNVPSEKLAEIINQNGASKSPTRSKTR